MTSGIESTILRKGEAMPKITAADVRVPMDVPAAARDTYVENYLKATRDTGRLMLFACDQKVEHMNKDFYGEGIDPADGKPEHLFQIGKDGVIGVLAGQRGLVAQYAADYADINYLIKMNSKTNLVGTKQEDPYSPQLTDIEAVLQMRENGVKKWQTDRIILTIKADTTTERLDTKRLKEEQPEIYAQYIKTSPVKGGLLIKTR